MVVVELEELTLIVIANVVAAVVVVVYTLELVERLNSFWHTAQLSIM